MATRTISTAEVDLAQETLDRARRAMDAIADFDQATVDRLCQAVAWATANLETSTRLANMSVDESGMGSREPSRRGKVLGILRDALRQKSMGIIEEIPEKGIVKYAKPAGVICALIPVTSPYITPIGIAIYAHQMQGRGDLFAASLEPQDDLRGGAPDARWPCIAWAFPRTSCSASSGRAFPSPTS